MKNNDNTQTSDSKSHFFLGIFYYNPEDKRIFPPKRNPWMGWTINFANPYSIGAFVILITAIIVLGRLFRHH